MRDFVLMSRDGKGERITIEVQSVPVDPVYVDCGGTVTPHGGRYRQCSLGHIHCVFCGHGARRYRRGLTCGGCHDHKVR